MNKFLIGLKIFNEEMTASRIVDILIMILAIIVANNSKEKVKMKTIILCLVVFILNGIVKHIKPLVIDRSDTTDGELV